MSREEAQLLLAISRAQELAIHAVRNASYKPHCCWMAVSGLARMADDLCRALDEHVKEQHRRVEKYDKLRGR